MIERMTIHASPKIHRVFSIFIALIPSQLISRQISLALIEDYFLEQSEAVLVNPASTLLPSELRMFNQAPLSWEEVYGLLDIPMNVEIFLIILTVQIISLALALLVPIIKIFRSNVSIISLLQDK